MSVRRTAFAVGVLVLAFVFVAAAPSARKPPSSSAPTNLRITASSATSITIAWDAPKTSSNNWWYCVQRDGAGCVRVDPPQTTHTRPLWPGTTYNFSVVVVDANGNRSASSNVVTFTTPPDTTAPSAPTLSEVAVWPMRAVISWTRSDDGGTSQVWYTLLVDGSPHPSFTEVFWYGQALILDLAPESTHTFQVRVRDFFGNRNESNTITVTTTAVTNTTPPTAPQNVRLLPQSSQGEFWLAWDQATDDSDPQSQILYDVYLNGVFGEHTALGSGTTITYCFGATGPTELVLRAVDTSGNSSGPSNTLLVDC